MTPQDNVHHNVVRPARKILVDVRRKSASLDIYTSETTETTTTLVWLRGVKDRRKILATNAVNAKRGWLVQR